MADNEQYDKEKNFEDKCRLVPEIQGRRTGPAQKGEPPARLSGATNQPANLPPAVRGAR